MDNETKWVCEDVQWICKDDRYCSERTLFSSVEEFLECVEDCFGEAPELREGRDRDGTTVCRDEYGCVVLRLVNADDSEYI